jgi:hypothetical protein
VIFLPYPKLPKLVAGSTSRPFNDFFKSTLSLERGCQYHETSLCRPIKA